MGKQTYLDIADLQASLQASEFVGAKDYELAIEASSRWIDDRCSDPCSNRIRHFWQEDSPTVRYYNPESPYLVKTGDFMDATALLVEVDLVGDGTWTTMPSGQWQAEPLNRLPGDPYTQLTVTTRDYLFPLGLAPRVRGTTPWGFADVPKTVTQACKILAVAAMLGTAVIGDENGYSVGTGGPTDPFALAESFLRRYLPDRPDPMVMLGKR